MLAVNSVPHSDFSQRRLQQCIPVTTTPPSSTPSWQTSLGSEINSSKHLIEHFLHVRDCASFRLHHLTESSNITLGDGSRYHHPHFIDNESEAQIIKPLARGHR